MRERIDSINPALMVFAALVVGTLLVVPFYFSGRAPSPAVSNSRGLIETHDLIQHIAIMQDFDKVLRSGVVYPRWLPDINNGYGIAWANFYPPLFFYLSSLFNALLNDWVLTLFVISALGFAASALAFYLLARAFYGMVASAIASLVYMAMPYHVINIYWQGAMPQFLGFVFLPLVVYFAFKAGAEGRPRYLAGLGLCYGLFLLTHLPVGYLLTYAIAFYATVWAIRSRDWRIAFRVGIGMAMGMMLAAIYLVPAALEARHAAEHFSAIFPYHSSYLTLLPLDSSFGNLVTASFTLQTLALIVAIVVLRKTAPEAAESATAESATGGTAPHTRSHLSILIIMGIATTFMNTSFSIYVSKLIPKIDIVSFAWRWMAIASLFAALLVGAALDRLRNKTSLPPAWLWAYRIALALVIASNLWLTARGVILNALSNPTHVQPPNYIEAAYTPAGSTPPQSLPLTADVTIQPGGGASEVLAWQPNRREIIVRLDQPGAIRLKTYNFPGWTARLDGQPAPITSDEDGVQVIAVPAGRHTLETAFESTAPRILGTALTGLGFLAILGFALVDRARHSERKAPISRDRVKGPPSNDALKTERETEKAGRRRAPSRRVTQVGLLALAGIGIIGILFWLMSAGSKTGSPDGAAQRRGLVTAGSDAALRIEGRDWLPVAVDEAALNELMNALPAGDEAKMEGLVQSGRVLRVRNNTRVRVLELGLGGKTRVRILEGDNIALEGLVPERWVR